MLTKLKVFIDRKDWPKVAGLVCLLLLGSVFEVAGIGAILPFLKIAGDPDVVLKHESVEPILAAIGVTTASGVVVAMSVAMLCLFLLRFFLLVLQWRFMLSFIFGKMADMARELMSSYMTVPLVRQLNQNTAELVRNVASETGNVANAFRLLMVLVTECFILAGLLILLLAVQPVAITLGVILIGSVAWGMIVWMRRELLHLGEITVEQQGEMIRFVNQGLGCSREVKLLGTESYFIEALSRSCKAFGFAHERSGLLNQYPRLILETSAVLGLVGVVALALLAGQSMQSVVPVLALFAVSLVRIVPSTNRIVNSLNRLRFCNASIDTLHQEIVAGRAFRDLAESATTDDRPLRGSLALDNVSYEYPDQETPAIDGISLSIRKGESVALVGPSGAGKTTLANLILGLLQPSSGRILVDDKEIGANPRGWQRHLGYIPQDIYLIDDSVRRNVALGLKDEEIDDERVWDALLAAQLDSFVRLLDSGLDTVVGERGARISAGQRQRIGIARALYHNPDLLVLDEATSALDTETERQFADAIDSLGKRKTLIIIAHRLTTVRRCDKIFVLEHGKLVGSGTYAKLLESNETFQRLAATSPIVGLDSEETVNSLDPVG